MNFEDLSAELQSKLKACKTEDELRELAKAVGLPLTDKQIESIVGGEGEFPWANCTNMQCLGDGCGSFYICTSDAPPCRGYLAPFDCRVKS